MSAHDTWLNSGNPLDAPPPPLDIGAVKRALEGIADEVEEYPHRWAKKYFAFDANHNYVSSTHHSAVAWSAPGFIAREFCGKGLDQEDELVEAATNALVSACGTDIQSYNDGLSTPADFVKWVREAYETL